MILPILLYNQQYVYDDGNNDEVKSVTVISVVTTVVAESLFAIITKNTALSESHSTVTVCNTISATVADEARYDMMMRICIPSFAVANERYYTDIDTESYADNTESSAIIMMTTSFHESPSAIHIEMPCAVNDGISSAAIADKAQNDYYDSDTTVSRASPSIVIDAESSTVSITYKKESSAGNDSSAIIMIPTAFHELPSAIHDEVLSAVADTVTSTISSADNDSLTIVTMATQVYASPSSSTSYYIDRESSGVSIAYETTSATVSSFIE